MQINGLLCGLALIGARETSSERETDAWILPCQWMFLWLQAVSWRYEDAEGCTASLPLCLAPHVCLLVCLFSCTNFAKESLIQLQTVFLPHHMHSAAYAVDIRQKIPAVERFVSSGF